MKETTLLEIGKISLNATTFEDCPEYDTLSLEWTESSPDSWYSDNDESIDIDKEAAVKLIEVLTAHFKL